MKYSIIIPVHNSIKYLPTCVNSVVHQGYDDYELIISDDSSTDGTREFIESIEYGNIKIVYTEKRLSVIEHFERAFKVATGEWTIFLGADDGLQAYFFELADTLTAIADEYNIRTIMSKRAYYFWRGGCESLYGKLAISYSARKEFKILDTKKETLKALLSLQTYFELPEMYTTSIFKRSVLLEAMSLQEGRVFSTIPPDANLGAIAMSLEKKYLKSFIPLGWVGTSSNRTVSGLILPENGVLEDGIEYYKTSGHYHIGACALYFWNALLRTNKLRDSKTNKKFSSKILKVFMFSGVLSEIRRTNDSHTAMRLLYFNNLLKTNNINKIIIKCCSYAMSFFFYLHAYFIYLLNTLKNILLSSHKVHIEWTVVNNVDMNTESLKIKEELKNKGFI
jgi:glycosyltransferase involved in cell wall biosynthesis